MNKKVKVLIIRFSSIGDIVLTTPVIRCLKKQLDGEVELHYVTKKQFKPILEGNPYLTKIHTIDKSTNEVIDELKNENFDYVIDLHRNLRSHRVKKALEALNFSFDKLNWQKWLIVNFKINKLPSIHIVDRYLNACKALGVKNDNDGLDYFFAEELNIDKLLPDNINKDYLAVVLGANHSTKRPTFDQYSKIVEKSKDNIVLIGGKEDHEIGYNLEKIASDKVFNACGKMTLNESAFIIKNAKAVISPDTGMMHVSAAFNKKIYSMWGNTIPEFGMTPYFGSSSEGESHIFETKDLKCRPCSKIGFKKCPKGHFNCMRAIDPKEITDKINTIN